MLAKFDLGFAELTSSTGYVDTPKKETNSEFLDYGFPMAVLFNQTAETLTQEFRLVSTNDSELQWIVGAFFVDAESEAGGFLQLDLSGWGLPITDQYIGDPIEMETMAIYAEIDYAFNEEWNMQFGLRAQVKSETAVPLVSIESLETHYLGRILILNLREQNPVTLRMLVLGWVSLGDLTKTQCTI